MLQNILVPIDGSENAWKALEAARGLAEKYQGDLVVLTVRCEIARVLSMDQEVIKNDRKELALIGNAILEEAAAGKFRRQCELQAEGRQSGPDHSGPGRGRKVRYHCHRQPGAQRH